MGCLLWYSVQMSFSFENSSLSLGPSMKLTWLHWPPPPFLAPAHCVLLALVLGANVRWGPLLQIQTASPVPSRLQSLQQGLVWRQCVIPLCRWKALRRVHVPHFIYSYISWWAFGLFPLFGYCAVSTSVQVLCGHFRFSWYIPGGWLLDRVGATCLPF